MSKLTDFKLLSFDVYGTLIDWETGIMEAVQLLLQKSNKTDLDKRFILRKCSLLQRPVQKQNPNMIYSELLTSIYPQLAEELGCEKPSEEECKAFGDSVGKWPAFPDSVSALHRLHKYYKLVVLSNVDNISFAASNSGPLQNVPFDAVLTAQDIGSYKPNHNNFEYMLREVKQRFGIEKAQVLQTAQSQFHDHRPAKELGITSSWIARYGSTGEDDVFNWKFSSLGEMADAVEKEAGES
ncbi:haloacid dehalogenase [Polyplosphaeria fusca]|uniref:Haloacid dehalogenase n=1 Tax=Polyplosphaeria fusca TaxID=682080 RepID=A0A9P4R183_9PLEO|nr:haloacid dehalogenase [Polyplosphaeria fusca]